MSEKMFPNGHKKAESGHKTRISGHIQVIY